MKRIAGIFEIVFDGAYLFTAFAIGITLLLFRQGGWISTLCGIMALVLASGDAFHLLPRILTIITKKDDRFSLARGRGIQVASITMTIFYLLLWQVDVIVFNLSNVGFLYVILFSLAALRVFLCLMPQNRWHGADRGRVFGILRNLPFFAMGLIVALMFFFNRDALAPLSMMWLAIALSFIFYIPVVLFGGRFPKLGMLMLPKSCAYIWMLAMCLHL